MHAIVQLAASLSIMLTGCASILDVRDVTLADGGAPGDSSTGINCIDGTFPAQIPTPIDIPDFPFMGIMSSISIMGSGTVASLALSLKITHPSPVDITINLLHVDGPSFTVRNGEISPFPDIEIDNDVITKFNGQPASGTWILQVEDFAETDVGTLDSWSLMISAACPPGVQ